MVCGQIHVFRVAMVSRQYWPLVAYSRIATSSLRRQRHRQIEFASDWYQKTELRIVRICVVCATKKCQRPKVCDNSFARSHHLQSHFRVHIGERPFSWYWCGKRLTQKSSLNIHMRSHEKKFICENYSKSFNNKAEIINHLRTCYST